MVSVFLLRCINITFKPYSKSNSRQTPILTTCAHVIQTYEISRDNSQKWSFRGFNEYITGKDSGRSPQEDFSLMIEFSHRLLTAAPPRKNLSGLS